MSNDVIEYESAVCSIYRSKYYIQLETNVANDITCTWSGKDHSSYSKKIVFAWKFDWSIIRNRRVDELTGYIIVKSVENHFSQISFHVKITEENRTFMKEVATNYINTNITYKYSLVPHYVTEPKTMRCFFYDEMFLPSEQNDTVLVVDGKKLHVCKAVGLYEKFLSYHSHYFRALFSSNYKESQMDEIPIEDVSFEDFGLLLSSFYPNPVFPNDDTVHKLLEMSRRFMVLSVINIIEYHLLNNSKIDDTKMLWLADEYGMPKFLEKWFGGMTVEKVTKLAKSHEYGKLSDSTKAKILGRLIKMI
ncbi:hypothetical protein CRE_22951 [Caenorhabditis remanei]|uniref:BTB domain-containing protein n=1 Tax=Caenorhabditis remanei TaxID=31234 RepID=E3MVZ9_CAERE|nr:hypothetical protein CRE_22951 [Caenorhabditis remanei]